MCVWGNWRLRTVRRWGGGNREELAVPASAAGVVWEPGKVAGSGGLGCAGRGPGEIL